MTQPQVQQKPFFSEPPSCSGESMLAAASRITTSVSPEAMTALCDEAEFCTQSLDLHPSRLDGVSSETVYVWAEQLEEAARKMQAIARTREAQGE